MSSYQKLINEFNSLNGVKYLKNKSKYYNIFYFKPFEYICIFNEIEDIKLEKYNIKKINNLISEKVYEKGIVKLINQYSTINKYDNIVYELNDIFNTVNNIDYGYNNLKLTFPLISYLERNSETYTEHFEDFNLLTHFQRFDFQEEDEGLYYN